MAGGPGPSQPPSETTDYLGYLCPGQVGVDTLWASSLRARRMVARGWAPAPIEGSLVSANDTPVLMEEEAIWPGGGENDVRFLWRRPLLTKAEQQQGVQALAVFAKPS